MGKQNQNKSLLSRLRRAVNKVKILLSSTILGRSWHIASVIRSVSMSKRQLSFNDRPGLMACTGETGYVSEDSGSSNGQQLQRTISYPSDDDIDKRADLFIANFRRQLRIERQISLQIRYGRGNSFEFVSPSP